MTDTRTPPGKARGAVIVTRVSTVEQAEDGTSLETQSETCRAKALALGLPVVAEYEDAGVSGGFLLLREGMQRALADLRAGRADTLICASISRYSRDVEHQQAIKKAVRACGGRVVFCDMEFDDTPEGDLAFNIMGGFAEYERKVIRERTAKGRRARAMDGRQPTRNRPPFGYHIVTKSDVLRGLYPADEVGRYQVVPEEAGYVREIFERYASGMHSLNDLAKWLNGTGIPTKRNGAFWRPTALRVLLRNTVYIGEAAFGKSRWRLDEQRLTEVDPRTGLPYRCASVQTFTDPEDWIRIECPAIIPADLWERAAARMTENRRQQGGNPGRARMLGGLMSCETCGGSMNVAVAHTATSRGRAEYQPDRYRCGSDRRSFAATGVHTCPPTHFPVETTERAVILAVTDACARPEAIRHALEEYARRDRPCGTSEDARRGLAAADKALRELAHEEAAAVRAQIAGIRAGASPGVYAEAFAQIAARRKELEERRGRLAAQAAPPRQGRTAIPADPEALRAQALSDVRDALTSPEVTAQERRRLLRTVVEKVVCQREGADVYFRPGAFPEETLHLGLPKWASRCSPSETALRWALPTRIRMASSSAVVRVVAP